MFKVGQIVVFPGRPEIYEIRGPASFSEGKPSAYTIMGVSGRGFVDIETVRLRLATPAEIAEGRRLIALKELAEAEEKQRRIKEKINKHRDFLIRRGIIPTDSNNDLATEVLARELRVAHCYACSATISNEDMAECHRCGWIVCSCGACGCGHEDYRDRYSTQRTLVPRQKDQSPDEDEVTFVDFTAAVEFIKEKKDYRLMRDGEAVWLATRKKDRA